MKISVKLHEHSLDKRRDLNALKNIVLKFSPFKYCKLRFDQETDTAELRFAGENSELENLSKFYVILENNTIHIDLGLLDEKVQVPSSSDYDTEFNLSLVFKGKFELWLDYFPRGFDRSSTPEGYAHITDLLSGIIPKGTTSIQCEVRK